MKIIDWRSKIDAIDTALLHMLNLRTELALEVGRLKAGEGVTLRVPVREQEILSRMKSLNPGPLKNDSIAKIYQVILDESIATQVLHGVGKAEPTIGSAPKIAPENAPEKTMGPRSGRLKKDRRWRK